MIFDPILDFFRGRAITIPPMDGAFRPNTTLDDASIFAGLSQPDNLVADGERLLASSGNAVFEVSADAGPVPIASFEEPVTALALSPGGELTVALETGRLFIAGKELALPPALSCITAVAYMANGGLFVTNGSARRRPSEWAVDLMEKGASGSLWWREPDAGVFREIAGELAFPFGIRLDGNALVVSESWRHRLVRFECSDGSRTSVINHLPGYPARLSPASDGGAWLSVFAPRNRLVEFVLQEDDYRRDMLEQVGRDHWIAPALTSGRSFLEPLQCGGIRTMGVHKPWSPSRSYGLVVKLDRGWKPVGSLHSRADGNRHGITSAVEHSGRLIAGAKGGDCLVAVDLLALHSAGRH